MTCCLREWTPIGIPWIGTLEVVQNSIPIYIYSYYIHIYIYMRVWKPGQVRTPVLLDLLDTHCFQYEAVDRCWTVRQLQCRRPEAQTPNKDSKKEQRSVWKQLPNKGIQTRKPVGEPHPHVLKRWLILCCSTCKPCLV